MDDNDIRGLGRQSWESYDQYCDRVDREVREAGEKHFSACLWSLPYVFILSCMGYVVWRYFQ